MSTDDARGLGEVLAEHECLYDRRVYPSFECSCGEWDGAQDDDGSESDGESDNAGAWRLHAAAALLASPQLARLIEQREAAARAEALREAAEAWAHSEWSNVLLPKPTPPAVPVIAYANRVGDWLRDRAVLAGQGGESGEGA